MTSRDVVVSVMCSLTLTPRLSPVSYSACTLMIPEVSSAGVEGVMGLDGDVMEDWDCWL